MPDLVSHDVCLGEITGCFESSGKLIVKTQVDVDLLITRTIKRTHRSASGAAGRACLPTVDLHFWLFIRPPNPAELRCPDFFGHPKNLADKLISLLFLRTDLRGSGRSRSTSEQHIRIDDSQFPQNNPGHHSNENAFHPEFFPIRVSKPIPIPPRPPPIPACFLPQASSTLALPHWHFHVFFSDP